MESDKGKLGERIDKLRIGKQLKPLLAVPPSLRAKRSTAQQSKLSTLTA
jgi:hypothetical protein